jgi:2-methylcitrate dehydratase PrpD
MVMDRQNQQANEDLGAVFARYAVSTTYEDLPAEAVRAAKQSTLDTLGVILGASGLQEAMDEVTELFRRWGGVEESTVLGFGGKMPAPSAAFVNGAMAHGLDFDDHLPEGHHPSSTLIPALFAVAESRGGVSGKEFITAVAIGQDLFARLRKYVHWKQDWFMTPVIGSLSTAVACAKLLRLDERQIVSTLGIASMQAAGTFQVAYGTGGNLRGTYAGYAAKTGVMAAYLAEAGVTGTAAPLEGQAGFLEVYFDNDYDREAMVANLGTAFEGSSILYKLWPSCGASHGYIDATLRLLGEAGRGEEIERIEVIGGDFAKRLSEPMEERRRPTSEVDAKFSIPFTVAVAVVRGSVGVGDFSAEKRSERAVSRIADKVFFTEDDKYNWSDELPASAVRITLVNGEVLEAETSHSATPGSTENPLTWDDLIRKFGDCASYAVQPLPQDRIEQIARTIQGLDAVSDVAEVMEACALAETVGVGA